MYIVIGHAPHLLKPVGLLFFFFVVILSFSVRAAGSDSVGAKYFLPEPLPMLSDLGSGIGFCFLASASVSWKYHKYSPEEKLTAVNSYLYFTFTFMIRRATFVFFCSVRRHYSLVRRTQTSDKTILLFLKYVNRTCNASSLTCFIVTYISGSNFLQTTFKPVSYGLFGHLFFNDVFKFFSS